MKRYHGYVYECPNGEACVTSTLIEAESMKAQWGGEFFPVYVRGCFAAIINRIGFVESLFRIGSNNQIVSL